MPRPDPSRPAAAVKAYLAGPDVFLPDARGQARRKVAVCARHGILGRPPLNEDAESLGALPDGEAWRAIFRKDLAMMEECEAVIANLTPFRGPSADAGTLVEVGWFLGRGKPVFGYSNAAEPFSERSRRQVEAVPDPLPGLSVEGFGPPAGRDRPCAALDVFERCVEVAAWKLGLRPPPAAAPPTADGR